MIHEHTSLLLCAHGSRDEQASIECTLLQKKIDALLPSTVTSGLGFLEFNQPSLHLALEQLYDEGARRIALVPLMLLAGNHVRQDIPQIGDAFAQSKKNVTLSYGADIGDDPLILELAHWRIRQALTKCAHAREKQFFLLVVGRGNEDETVNNQLRLIARKIADGINMPHDVCFAGLAHPDIKEGLDKSLARGGDVIVLPYLLFAGLLTKRLHDALEEFDVSSSVILCEPLGAHDLLARLLVRRGLGLLHIAGACAQ